MTAPPSGLFKLMKMPFRFFTRLALISLVMMQLYWLFLDFNHFMLVAYEKTNSIQSHHTGRNESSDVFALDIFGRPISREEVQMDREHYVKGRKYFMTIGLATVERIKDGKRTSYLSQTLNDLNSKIPEAAKREVAVVILCANRDALANRRIYDELYQMFPKLIENGQMQLIVVPPRFYHRLDNVPQTYNDSRVRMMWRSKQSLDYAFLLYYCHGLGDFHFQIEDDVEVEAGFYEQLKLDIAKSKSTWAVYQYYKMGFIGKLIPSRYLQLFADIFRIFYFEMPLDLLYDQPFKLCRLEGRHHLGKFLFHHIGQQSSSENSKVY